MKQIVALLCLLLIALASKGHRPVFTHVTALYDIGRGELKDRFKRPFDFYLSYFEQLLQAQANIIVFGTRQLQEFVWLRRKPHNTVFVLKEMDYFKNMWYFPLVQQIRKQKLLAPFFERQQNPQYTLEYYNAVVFSKMYMLEQATIHDKFHSDYLVWTDAGLNHVFSHSMSYPVNHIMNWFQMIQPQWLFFTSDDDTSVFIDVTTGLVTRSRLIMAGLFGGSIQTVRDVRCTYENILRITLEEGKMDSEESVFNVLLSRYPYLYPTAVYSYPMKMYNELHAFPTYRRQPSYPRIFEPNFDNQGNIHVIENKTITKYVLFEEEKILELSRDPTQRQIKNFYETNQLYKFLGKNQHVIYQIFQHEAIFLSLMVALYIFSKYKNRELVALVAATTF